MLKKILIVFGVLLVLAVIGVGVFSYNVASKINEAFKGKEPEFRQYVTMTVEDQNAYIEKNLKNIMQILKNNIKDNTQAQEDFEKMSNDPEAIAAGIEVGRSIIAGYILDSETLSKEISEDVKGKLQVDVNQMDARLDKYSKVAKKYGIE